jgi:hypothetical protein
MKNTAKKIVLYSMVGLMQVGLGTAVVAASPLYNDGSQQIVQLDARHDQENARHEQEMRRHAGENDRDWHARQDKENQRHEQFQ